MKKLADDLKAFCSCKFYMVMLALAATASYGFAITHQSIGMDDTVIPLYFEDGLAPYVGRWTLFVINKVFHISDFAPWMVELASVLILMLSVTLWCVLWRRICEPKVKMPVWSYAFVAAIFLSCPLISEVFVFYLHNGVCTGYGVVAVAVLALMNALKNGRTMGERAKWLASASVLLTVALGFYESFIIVYIMGAIMCFFLIRCLYGKKGEGAVWKVKLLPWLGSGLLTVGVSFALRAIILTLLNVVYGLEKFNIYNVLYRSYFGDIFTVEGELAMVLKRFIAKYYINGVAYLPIAVLVAAIVFIGGYALYRGIRGKDLMLPVCAVTLVFLPIAMSLVEGLVTRYRTAQYVPLVCAFAVLLLLLEVNRWRAKDGVTQNGEARRNGAFVCCYLILGILIFNQCTDMNRWFYLDYLKYQDAKTVMDRIAYDLEKNYDISKPIVFRGGYTVPYEICGEAYARFGSKEYQWISALLDPIDAQLKEKYFSAIGYQVAESPVISTLQWGVTAFDGTAQQLIEFWKMHGNDSFYCVTDLAVIEEAERIRVENSMPGYPKSGYIMECENYIIVNLADVN